MTLSMVRSDLLAGSLITRFLLLARKHRGWCDVKNVSSKIRTTVELFSVKSLDFVYGPMMDDEVFTEEVVEGGEFVFA